MSRKKKKTTAADNLIESLMEDLKDIQAESSFNSEFIQDGSADSESTEDSALPLLQGDEYRVDNTSASGNLWENLESSELGSTEPPPIFDSQSPPGRGEDKTVSIQQDLNLGSSAMEKTDVEKTLPAVGFANANLGHRRPPESDVKVSVGQYRGSRGSASVMTSIDASLAQAENLKIAQHRILELEKEVEQLRAENEELATAGEFVRSRSDELGLRISALEKEKLELQESAQSEMLILKGSLQFKENEVAKARIKVDELETRLKSDFKKIRVRERELENRLELLRAEKSALIRSKDEYILDQKRKIDQLSQELDNYRKKCLELNKTIEANQDQVKRTERALRLALTNLEATEENLVPLKKAE